MPAWKRTLYAMWFAQLLAVIGFSLRNPYLPYFLEDLGTQTFEQQALWAGFITGGGSATMAVAAPLWGVVADRYGRKLMVLRAMYVASITVSFMAVATSPWHLLALRFIEGAMTGTVAAAITLIASSVPRERLGFAMGLMQMAVFSGSSVGPMIGGILADLIGFRASFVVAGAMLFLGGSVVLILVRENFQRPDPVSAAERSTRVSTRAILFGGSMMAMMLVLMVARVGQNAVQPLAPLFIGHLGAGDAASTFSGIALGVMGISSAISSVLLGRLSDRLGHRSILVLSVLLAGFFFFPQASAQSPVQYILAMAMFGLALGGILPTTTAIIANLVPADRRGVIYGFSNTAMSIGAFIGPIAGTIIAATINMRFAFVFLGLTMVLTAIWVWYSVPKSIDERQEPATADAQSD